MVAFSRATPGAMAHRRIVSANRPSRKQEFLRHISALNTSFHQWFKKEIDEDSTASLIDGVQDYIDHACQLKDRYLRSHGEVLTFGNGECGQLAHGVENEEDTTVKYPRIVYSLRNKKVVGIACGGIHNAVFTETGQVYTWGCNDDGSLGRETGETMVCINLFCLFCLPIFTIFANFLPFIRYRNLATCTAGMKICQGSSRQ